MISGVLLLSTNQADLVGSPTHNPVGIHSEDKVVLPANNIPSFAVNRAFERGVQNNFLINTWGGLGDQICAEPAIRYAFKAFKKCSISLASNCPSIYSHLNYFKDVFDTRRLNPPWEKYLTFQTILPPSHLLWEFASHMLTHCVDFPSICMFRCQLPVADREIHLPDFPITPQVGTALAGWDGKRPVIVHPGKHWQSKTFPKMWWDQVLNEFHRKDIPTVLIGHSVDENVGFVDADPKGSIDLRDKLVIPEFVSLLKNASYILSNDSSPIHAAASGDAFIGFIASCKHPDYITHWRQGEFGYKTKNFGLDGVWNYIDSSPVQEEEIVIENISTSVMDKILPRPSDLVALYIQNMHS